MFTTMRRNSRLQTGNSRNGAANPMGIWGVCATEEFCTDKTTTHSAIDLPLSFDFAYWVPELQIAAEGGSRESHLGVRVRLVPLEERPSRMSCCCCCCWSCCCCCCCYCDVVIVVVVVVTIVVVIHVIIIGVVFACLLLVASMMMNQVASPFSISVKRNSDAYVIFDSSVGGFTYTNQYLQFSNILSQTPNIYGLGEHRDPLHLDYQNHKYTMWARDAATPVDQV